jgi:hypothetical protein
MNVSQIIFSTLGAVFLVIGLIATFTGQLFLIYKIKEWNVIKACISIIPLLLLVYIKFDNQVQIICRNFPKHTVYFKKGLLTTSIGIGILLLAKYIV